MKVANRREAILDAVQKGTSDLTSLCEKFGVSEATARRDLHVLQQEGRLLRTYGGAVAQPIQHEPEESLESRQSHHHAAKTAIGRQAARLVAEGDTIFIDAGTTAQFFAMELPAASKATVFTNNLLAVQVFAGRGMAVSLLGGDLRAGSMSVFGPLADLSLERLTFDKVFTSADGVDADLGLCEGSAEQAWFKEKVFRRAREVVVLATAEKLSRRSQTYWTPMNRAWTLVTDAPAQHYQLKPFVDHVLIQVVSGQGGADGG
jgi:DeoR/GlpR family transcriptional regulator of sugar metabolism